MNISSFTAYPFFRLLLFLSSGVLFHLILPSEISDYTVFILLSFCAFLIVISLIFKGKYKYRWVKGIVFFLLFFIFGFLLKPGYRSEDSVFHNKRIYRAEVTDVLKLQVNRQTILLNCRSSVENKNLNFKVIAYYTVDSGNHILLPGDVVFVNSIVQRFIKETNPFVFDYGNYLKKQDVIGFVNLKQDALLFGEANYTAKRYLFQLKQSLKLKLSKLHLSQDGSAIVLALVLGDKSELSSNIKSDFSKSGVIHVLAISGMHVGIIFLLLSGLFKQIDYLRLKWLKVVLILFFLWFYAFLTGLSPSVLRATIMFSVLVLAQNLNQSYHVYHTMFIAAFIIIIIDPYAFSNAGFWLSFLAVGSIVYFYPIINGIVYFSKPWNKYIWSLVSVSIAVQIGTAPLTIYLFGFFPLWFLLSNILVVPFIPIVLSCVIFMFFLPSGGFIFQIMESIVSSCLNYCQDWISWSCNLPFASFVKIQFSGPQLFLFYITLLFIIGWHQNKKNKFLLFGLFSLVALAGLNLTESYYKNSSEAFIVYDIPKQSLMAVIKGNRQCDLYTSSLSDENHNRYISPLLSQFEVQQETIHALSDKGVVGMSVLSKNVLVINHLIGEKELGGLVKDASVVVFTKDGFFKDANNILDKYEDKQFVFDASFSPKNAVLYAKEFTDKKVKVHFVSLEGAFVYKQQTCFF